MSAKRSLARGWLVRGAVAGALAVAIALPAAEETTITIWSHEADEPAKVAWREKAARNFEAKNPDVKVKITWYDKPALNAALRTALRAGQGPDIFYAEPDQVEYITNGFATPLDDLVNWNNIYDWARGVWTHNGKTYGLPQEAYTIELYYNKELMKKVGVTLPPSGQVGHCFVGGFPCETHTLASVSDCSSASWPCRARPPWPPGTRNSVSTRAAPCPAPRSRSRPPPAART